MLGIINRKTAVPANLHNAPDQGSPAPTTIPIGAHFVAGDKANDQYTAARYGKESGYVWTKFIDFVKPKAGKIQGVRTAANIHSKPSLTSPVIGKIPLGAALEVYDVASSQYTLVIYNGILGYAWTKFIKLGTATQPVDYKQYDKKWAGDPYTINPKAKPPQTIKSSGCGPTSMADILAAWFDPSITPVETCKMAVDHGYRTKSSGTSRAFFDWIAKQYPFKKYKRTTSTDEVIAALEAGAWVVALMGPGDWTKGGHYICIWKSDGAYFYACNPSSSTRTKGKISKFRKQRKEYFIYYK